MQVLATYLQPATVTYALPPNGNPGVVPPWLLGGTVGVPPAGDHMPRVLGENHPTVYLPDQPIADPDLPHIM